MMRLVLLVSVLGGCTLIDTRNDGPDDDTPNPDGGGSNGGGSPVGRMFSVQRSFVDGDPCGFFQETQPISVSVTSTTGVLVDVGPSSAVTVRPVAAREDRGDPPNVLFKHSEVWEGELGIAQPTIDQQLWVDGPLITGRATSSFQHDDGTVSTFCSYNWRLTGNGAP